MRSTFVEIQKMSIGEVKDAMQLVLSEGWNQTKDDWDLLINGSQNICLAAKIDGKLVATAAAINYENKVAWIGMVLVNKENRGKGISKILLKNLFDELKSCPSIKLDATSAGQPVYKKVGFIDEYLINRMTNTSFNSELFQHSGIEAKRIEREDIQTIIEFDKQVFGVNRTQLIQSLIENYLEKCWVLKRNNNLTGFILGRKGNKYHQIGPLSAGSLEDAKILITQALRYLKGQPIIIDVLDDKKEYSEWLNTIGFVKQRDFIRMFKGNNLYHGDTLCQYSICGPEFG